MSKLNEFWKDNKKGYIFSTLVATLGSYIIILIMHQRIKIELFLILPILCASFIFITSFLLYCFLSFKKGLDKEKELER
jgi:hypothetical protein